MSWLRTRRRTLDIANDENENEIERTKDVNSMNNGTFTAITNVHVCDTHNSSEIEKEFSSDEEKEEEQKYITNKKKKNLQRDDRSDRTLQTHSVMSVLMKQPPEGNVTVITVEPLKNNDVDINSISFEDDVFDNSNQFEKKNGLTTAETKYKTRQRRWTLEALPENEICLSPSTTPIREYSKSDQDVSTNTDISIEEEREIKFMLKSCLTKPRRSIDSQMTMISHKLKDDLPPLPEGDSLEETRRRSISWAEDLETIHEFEKIKNRKLSLSGLFKKL